MPIDLEFRLRKGGLWELGFEPTQRLVDFIPGEQALRMFAFNETEFAVTNARLVKVMRDGATESAWWCKIRGAHYPAKSLIEGPREELTAEPRGVLFVERPFVIEAATEPIRERSASDTERHGLGLTYGLLHIATWCKMQHDHRPLALEQVGLMHAPDCPFPRAKAPR